ncbi:hypothetical protein ACFVVA_40145 [Kitasatospora sp. NPDC058048]|uniref:hypothetical protein n=1 Tax=Kitasatospora sp. NPDC058048 TaxID=3346313 RepID=UPI0036DACFE0
MGIHSFLGLGSSSSGSGSSETSTRTSGMSTTGWHRSSEADALRHHREAQAPVTPAATDPYSRPDGSTRRNFGRSCDLHNDGGAQ